MAENRPQRPGWLRAHLARWPLLLYRLGLGFLLARQVLVLTTRGRTTGKPRKTPLWYVRDEEVIYCLSGWGASSDWLKNLQAAPRVLVQIGRERWETQGTVVLDHQERETVVQRFHEKYGRLVPVFFHSDQPPLVAFPFAHDF